MVENKDLISILEGQIETRILPNKNYPYVPASAVRSRLNKAFGGRWNTHIVKSETVNDDTVLIIVELACMNGDEKIIKEGFGSAPIQKYNSGPNQGKPVNLGDAYGNALMDGIKACAKQLGIGNKEMDVKKDPKTGRYIQAGDTSTTSTTVTEQTRSETVQPKPETVQSKIEPDANPDDAKATKIIELRKKLEANKSASSTKTETKSATEPKTEPESEPEPEPKSEEIGSDYGFDYGGVGNSDEGTPKNTQKLVILNLAKMQKLTPEEYINKALGKTKTIDELTAEEAGQVVRAGLSKFE
jgi:hypothetical protein